MLAIEFIGQLLQGNFHFPDYQGKLEQAGAYGRDTKRLALALGHTDHHTM
jgi:hypothetical protein